MTTDLKKDTWKFLQSVERRLNQALPNWREISRQVPEIVATAKTRSDSKHKRTPEDAFLYHYALPILSQYLLTDLGMSQEDAKSSLLSEYYRNMPFLTSGSPARAMRHGNPFGKAFTNPHEIMKRWRGEAAGAKVQQPCPDFALRAPFPHSIVFEGKYFARGGPQAGETHLVETSYQAFFYRAQPPAGANSSGALWDYDYACLFACDVSKDASLFKCWRDLDEDVRNSFWNGGNIYVMILRPE